MSGPATITFYWSLYWHAQATAVSASTGASQATSVITLYGNVLNTANGQWLYATSPQTSVFSVTLSYPLPALTWWGYGNQLYTVTLLNANLVKGTAYQFQSFLYENTQAFGLGIGVAQGLANVGSPNSPYSGSMNAISVIYGGGSGGGGGCVAKGTPILTPTGYVPVQNLHAGATVTEFNLTSLRQFNGTFVSANSTTVGSTIVVNNGLLNLTPTDQPIFMQNSTYYGWFKDPQNLTRGDQLLDPLTLSWINVTSITTVRSSTKVYDVVTSGANNFISNGILLDKKTNG